MEEKERTYPRGIRVKNSEKKKERAADQNEAKIKKKVNWGKLRLKYFEAENVYEEELPIPVMTKGEKSEAVVEELRDYFPGTDTTDLVVRRRKNSNASIDLDDPMWNSQSSQSRNGRDTLSGNDIQSPSLAYSQQEQLQDLLKRGYRKRSSNDGSIQFTELLFLAQTILLNRQHPTK